MGSGLPILLSFDLLNVEEELVTVVDAAYNE